MIERVSRTVFVDPLEPRRLLSSYALSDVATFADAPADALVMDGSGNLFGTTSAGGANGAGSIYKVAAGSSEVTTLASFGGSGGGVTPIGPIAIDSRGDLFGATAAGGVNGLGTIFELPHGGSSPVILASFSGVDGASPGHAGVILDANGNLYGATGGGGNTAGDGIVYELPHGSSTIVPLATFAGSDSGNPQGRLIRDSSGNLFGTTRGIGANGAVYEVAAGSGAVTPLVAFNGSNGQNPSGVMVADSSGDLFGTTESGGANNGGTIFKVIAGSNALVTLASFDASRHPVNSGLVLDPSGNLFGATSSNPANGDGSLFELRSGRGQPVILATFNPTLGTAPTALIADGAGGLFGVAGSGTLFHLTKTSSGPQATTLALQVSTAAPVIGQPVTFTAIVAPASAVDETPAGIVEFIASGTIVGTAPLDSSGAVTFSTTMLSPGENDVEAHYDGDIDSLASDSTSVTVTVASSGSTPFSDTFAIATGRTVGQSLSGAVVQSSPADAWVTSGVGDYVFGPGALRTTDAGADVARVYRSLGSDNYDVSANVWLGSISTGTWFGVGFFDSGNDPAAGDPLFFRIQNNGDYELDATGADATPAVLASGTVDTGSWSAARPPRLDLSWNASAGTASADINGVAVASNVDLSRVPGLDSSNVNSVGFARQGDSDTALAVSNFAFANGSSPITNTSTGLLPVSGKAGLVSNALGFTTFVASAEQGSNTIVVGNTAGGFALARLTSSGALDTSFGTAGMATGSFAAPGDVAAAVSILPDNSIMVAGTASGSAFAVEHFSDSGIALGSTVLPHFSTGSTDTLHALAISPGGIIYLAGQTTPSFGAGDFAIAAIDENGTPVSFGRNGQVILDLGGVDVANSVAVQTNGRVVLAGWSVNGSGIGSVALARLKSDGSLDKTFDRNGAAITSVRALDDGANAMSIQRNGAILIGGWSASSSTTCDALVMRYTPFGHVDPTFATAIGSFAGSSSITQVAFDALGNIIAAGKSLPSVAGYSGGDTNLLVMHLSKRGKAITFSSAVAPVVDLGVTFTGTATATPLRQFETSANGSLQFSQDGSINIFGDAEGATVEAGIVAGGVDLATALAGSIPATRAAGKSLAVSIKVTEIGTLDVSGPLTITFALKPSAASLALTPLRTLTVNTSIKVAKSKVFRAVITLPAGLNGVYILRATAVAASDLNLQNNTVQSTGIAIT